jgi:hypothetical protein
MFAFADAILHPAHLCRARGRGPERMGSAEPALVWVAFVFYSGGITL